ncbi:SRPBCC family protein [Mycobacterium sp. NPDC050041]|uniref:SRPBCC family protein n=1 Tax=Mycobacterium sp. NPDC050041 TaxID=3364293 RepID=UPI003C2C0EAD
MRLDGRVASISRSRTIAAPPQVIFDVLADFGALSTWADDVTESTVLDQGSDGPLGTSRRVKVGRDTLVETITEFDAPRALAYDIEGLPKILRDVSNRWTLRPGNGSTDVTVTSSVRVSAGPVSKVAEWVVTRVMARKSDGMLAGMARRTETG